MATPSVEFSWPSPDESIIRNIFVNTAVLGLPSASEARRREGLRRLVHAFSMRRTDEAKPARFDRGPAAYVVLSCVALRSTP